MQRGSTTSLCLTMKAGIHYHWAKYKNKYEHKPKQKYKYIDTSTLSLSRGGWFCKSAATTSSNLFINAATLHMKVSHT